MTPTSRTELNLLAVLFGLLSVLLVSIVYTTRSLDKAAAAEMRVAILETRVGELTAALEIRDEALNVEPGSNIFRIEAESIYAVKRGGGE